MEATEAMTWVVTLDLSKPWNNEELSIREKITDIVSIIRKHDIYQDDIIESIVEEMQDLLTDVIFIDDDDDYVMAEEFDELLDSLYDWCDSNRVWVNVWTRS